MCLRISRTFHGDRIWRCNLALLTVDYMFKLHIYYIGQNSTSCQSWWSMHHDTWCVKTTDSLLNTHLQAGSEETCVASREHNHELLQNDCEILTFVLIMFQVAFWECCVLEVFLTFFRHMHTHLMYKSDKDCLLIVLAPAIAIHG